MGNLCLQHDLQPLSRRTVRQVIHLARTYELEPRVARALLAAAPGRSRAELDRMARGARVAGVRFTGFAQPLARRRSVRRTVVVASALRSAVRRAPRAPRRARRAKPAASRARPTPEPPPPSSWRHARVVVIRGIPP